jgi:phenylalanyl-tRNA synthetase beta chain
MFTGAGFSEITTNSVTQSKFEQEEQLKKQQVLLLNSQTSELDCMRTSMLYSGLEVIAYNQNRKQSDLKLYEFGKTYHKTADGYSQQQQHLVIYFTGKTAEDNWLTKGKKYDFYHLKSAVENVLLRMGVHATSQDVIENSPFTFASSWKHEEDTLATFGQVNKTILSNFDIKNDVFFADINWDVLTTRSLFHQIQFSALPKFPAVRRDLAMLVGADLQFDSIQKLSFLENKKILKDVSLFDVYEGDKIEAGKKSYAVSFTFQDKDKTLTDQDVDKVMTRLMTKLESELKVQIRK